MSAQWIVVADEYRVSVHEARADGTTLEFANLVVGQFIRDHERAQDRARLMAAAPELLAALQRYLDCDGSRDVEGDTPAKQALAVIAKVAGMCERCGLPPGCPDCRAVHDVPEGA